MIPTSTRSYRHWSDAEGVRSFAKAGCDSMQKRWAPKFCEITTFDIH